MNGFITTLEQAEEFFRRCQEQQANTIEKRLEILNQMAKERLVFHQTEEQLNKRMNKKKVLVIKNGKQRSNSR